MNGSLQKDGQRADAAIRPPRILGDLRRRVLGWMLLISLVPLIVMAAQGYHCAMQALVDRSQAHLAGVARERANLLDNWLEERVHSVEFLAQFPAFRQSVRELLRAPNLDTDAAIESILSSVRRSDPAFDHLFIVDESGAMLASTRPLPPHGNIRQGGGAEQDPLVYALDTRISGDWIVTSESADVYGRLDIPIKMNRNDPAPARLVALVNLTRVFGELLHAQTSPKESIRYEAVMDRYDIRFASNRPSEAVGLWAPETSAGTDLQVSRYTDPRDRSHLVARLRLNSAWFSDRPVFLVAETEESQAMAWLGTLRFRATLTGVVTLVVLIVFALWISDRLGRPLQELARVANAIRSGNSKERLEPMRGAEARVVGEAVNQMLDELQEQQQTLVRTSTLASIGELSSSIVHEIRNPLSSIKMNLQGLRHSVQDNSRDLELAQIACQQVERVENMLDDLLNYGKPVELDQRPVVFQDLARNALAVVQDHADAKNVSIETVDELMGSEFTGDPEQLCRALTNLLTNAIQASPEGGSVILRARKSSLWRGSVLLEVGDSGAGIADEIADRLFKPFFTTKTGGTGLGLANIRKIMDLHQGSATAANNPDGGALFTLELPQQELAS